MPAQPCVLTCGTLPATNCPVDEPNILVQSLTISASREEKEYKNASGCTNAVQFNNPKIEFQYDAYVSTQAGLADQHPGTQVTSLANYAGSRFGFEPTDGCLIYLDPTLECSNEDLERIKFTVRQYPFTS